MITAHAFPVATADSPVDSRFFLAPVAGAGWLAGILLAGLISWSAPVWLGLALPLLAAAVIYWRRGRVGLALAACGALALGGARWAAAQPAAGPGYLSHYVGLTGVTALGSVVEEPAIRDTNSQLRVAVAELAADGQTQPVEGVLLVETGRFPAYGYGDEVRLTGDLLALDSVNDTDYAAYLVGEGIAAVMRYPGVERLDTGGESAVRRALYAIKDRGREVIQTTLPEPHAALLTGILLGDSSGLPRQLRDDFRKTGMTHIIAISGFNVAVIIALLDQLAAPLLPRRTAAMAIMLFIGLYAVLVGAGASVVRAALMGVVYLIGLRLLGRPTLAVSGLFVAAFLMTLADPHTLRNVGFQLSFAATLGLMLYAGPWGGGLDRRLAVFLAPETRGRVLGFLREIVLVTLAAQVLVLPLLAYHFGQISLASLPANVFIVPAQTGLMTAGGVTLLLGLAWPGAGQLTAWVAWLFLEYTIEAVRLAARLPLASVPWGLSGVGLAAIYALIALLTVAAKAGPSRRREAVASLRLSRPVLAVLAGVAIVIVGFALWASGRPDGRLHVAFLDVGQGDAIFIQTPNGRQLLVDGGRYPSVALEQLGRQMPFWDRSLDLALATHPDDDHVAGLVEVVERYRVSRLLTNGAAAGEDPAYDALLAAAEGDSVPIHAVQTGEAIVLDEGVRLEIVHAGGAADAPNDASAVVLLTYGEFSLLLTGDAGTEAETAMLQSGQPIAADVLKAGHHGANTSSSAPFLAAVAPQVVIISVGADNTYGHPTPEMLARAAEAGAVVLRTDELGTIELTSDGQSLWWTAEHAPAAALP